MRINNVSSVIAASQYNKLSKKVQSASPSAPKVSDKVEFSSQAMAFNNAKTAAIADTGVREEVVAGLRQEYLNGTYSTDAENVALSIMKGINFSSEA